MQNNIKWKYDQMWKSELGFCNEIEICMLSCDINTRKYCVRFNKYGLSLFTAIKPLGTTYFFTVEECKNWVVRQMNTSTNISITSDNSIKNDNQAYKILTIDDLIKFPKTKEAYRKLCSKYHPDKNPLNIEIATKNMAMINNYFGR